MVLPSMVLPLLRMILSAFCEKCEMHARNSEAARQV